MKTKLAIIFALALTCLGADPIMKITTSVDTREVPTSGADPIMKITTSVDTREVPTSGVLTLPKNAPSLLIPYTLKQNSSMIVGESPPTKEIFRVSGLSSISLGDPPLFGSTRYAAPDKPEDVKVTLYTKDGKRWSAQWVEDSR